jgi:hypothetical protein
MTARAFWWMILGAAVGSVVAVLVLHGLKLGRVDIGGVLGGVVGAHVGRRAGRGRSE